MSKNKKWAITGAILLGGGVLICAVAFAMLGFDIKKLNTLKLVSNTYEISDDFNNISIDADIENISFALSNDGRCKVICYEEEDDTHNVRVENNTLMIDKANKKHINISFFVVTESPTITVYLPKTYYQAITVNSDTSDIVIPKEYSFESINVTLSTGDVTCLASANGTINIGTDTGNINISDISAADIKLSTDTGDINISDVTLTENMRIEEDTGDVTIKGVSCKKLTWLGDTGDLIMTDVIASDEFKLEGDTGDIEFNDCDAGTIYAKTDTGDITGTLLGDKVFITETDTGKVNVPKTITGGRCELTTDTGDIRIKLQ